MRLDQKGLRLKIRDTADPQISLHLSHVPVKFGPERRILDVVDSPVKPVRSVGRHSASSGSQVRMVIDSVKQFQYTIFL